LVTDNKIEMSHKNNVIIKAMGGHLKCISLEWTGSLTRVRFTKVTKTRGKTIFCTSDFTL